MVVPIAFHVFVIVSALMFVYKCALEMTPCSPLCAGTCVSSKQPNGLQTH